MMKPSLTAWVIAKNESRDLPRCLDSIAGIADHIIVVDTGSNDETVRVAAERGCSVHGYHDASMFIEGQWQLQDFSKARNYAIEQAEKTGCDWWMWMDADDELMHPQSVRRSLYLPAYDCFAIW